MLEQTATVVDTRQDKLLVEVLPESTCTSCSVKKGCGTGMLAASVGRKVIQFEMQNTVAAVTGDRLVLGLPEDAVLKGSLLMYLVPLLIMFAAALAADQLLPLTDSLRDLKIALLALAALAGSVVLGRRFLKHSTTSYEPVILRKQVTPATAAEVVFGADSDMPS